MAVLRETSTDVVVAAKMAEHLVGHWAFEPVDWWEDKKAVQTVGEQRADGSVEKLVDKMVLWLADKMVGMTVALLEMHLDS